MPPPADGTERMGFLKRAPLGTPAPEPRGEVEWIEEVEATPSTPVAPPLPGAPAAGRDALRRELERMETAALSAVDEMERRLRAALDEAATLRRDRDRLQRERDTYAAVLHELKGRLEGL